ncbi:MAG: ImmA/IrrE family metallo-endopeptidase [Armatimonadetes bacterium]|nr:ImmA/IrrE family metallo-endopeptidase [Armatimonadota bacterium]
MLSDAAKDHARARAARLLVYYGIDRPDEIDLDAIAFDNGIEVERKSLPGCEGRLMRWPGGGRITVDESHGIEGRTRFSIAHELGHWFLHGDLDQAFWHSDTNETAWYKGSDVEQEANEFAAELLLPEVLLKPIAMQRAFEFPAVDHVAGIFRVSLTVAGLGLSRLSKDECAVVLSDGETVWWCARNRKLGEWYFHIARGTKLSDDSKAWHAPCEGDEKMTPVLTTAWFPQCPHSHRLEVWEASRELESIGHVLTLLAVNDL